ncbi:MAG: bacterial proteasome activator family protein, partial [Brevibacterium sp.]|nr:bacterial proteasome activator family protein [Brevibacterium sp.]
IEELERLDLPFDSGDGPPTTSELRIAQAQLVGWLEGLFHGIQTAIMAQQAMAQQELAGHGQLPPGMVAPGAASDSAKDDQTQDEAGNRGTGNYL